MIPTWAPSRGGVLWEHLCLVRFWISSLRGLPQERSGIWVHLCLQLPCEGLHVFSHKEAWQSLPLHGLQEAERHQSGEPAPPASFPGVLWTSAVGSLVDCAGSTRCHYEHPVMPFSLCNARATFQYSINAVLRNLLHSYAVAYLDDILVFCTSR